MKVGVLCSGVALGVYVPGLYVQKGLAEQNVSSEVYVIETILLNEKMESIPVNKKAYHANFRLAVMGQKMARDMMPSIDPKKYAALMQEWSRQDVRYFVVLSGFWLPLLHIYQETYPQLKIAFECLHLDSVPSPSWEKSGYTSAMKSSWMFRRDTEEIVNVVEMSRKQPIPFSKRDKRLLIHGGGWGMGTYQTKIPQLREAGYALNIIAYYPEDVDANFASDRYYMMDPNWHPWMRNEQGEHEFPPFAQVKPGEAIHFINNPRYHDLLDISMNSIAIVSKPGGGTLLESLISATPIILLEAFGEHETKNAELLQRLGFGLSYESWKESNYDGQLLEKMHHNLLSRFEHHPQYVHKLVQTLREYSDAA